MRKFNDFIIWMNNLIGIDYSFYVGYNDVKSQSTVQHTYFWQLYIDTTS